MDLMQLPPALPLIEPTLILITWTAVLGLLALAFVLLVRRVDVADNDEADALAQLLQRADQVLAGYEARERRHLQEIARLRRRLADIEGLERAA